MNLRFDKKVIIVTIILIIISFGILHLYLLPNHIFLNELMQLHLLARCPEVCYPLNTLGNLVYLIISAIISYFISSVIFYLIKK